jgi:hypothetical protein
LTLDPEKLKPIIAEELSAIIAERAATLLKLADDLLRFGADDAAKAATKLADDVGKTGKSVSALRKSSNPAERELGRRYQSLSRQRAKLSKGSGGASGRATAKGAQTLGQSGLDDLKNLIDKGATGSVRLPAASGREAITVTVTREGGKSAVRTADDVAAQGMDDVAGLLGQAEAAAAKGDSNKVIEIFKQLDSALEKLPGVGKLYATRLGKAYAVGDVSSRVVTAAVDDESWSVPQWLVKTLGALVVGGALAGTLYFTASDSDEVDISNMGQEEVNLGRKGTDITSKMKASGIFQPGNIYILSKPSRAAGKDSKYRGKVVISKYKGSTAKPENLVARFISDPGGFTWSFVEIRGNDELDPVTFKTLYRKSGDPNWKNKLKATHSKLKSIL